MADKQIGELIDVMYEFDLKIDLKEAAIKKLKAARLSIENKLMDTFNKSKINGANGSRAIAKIERKSHPSIKDRAKFDKWVYKNKALDLFTNHLAARAYADRIAEGESIPGITVFNSVKIKLTKKRK